MHFTRTRDEKHYGMEFCCDICNRKADEHPRWVGNNWWYLRYSETDEYPSMWICKECKEGFEDE